MISKWRYLNKNVRVGYGWFSADAFAVIPWFFVIFNGYAAYVAIFVDLIYLFCKVKKIKIRMLGRYIRVKLSGGKMHMSQPSWKKRGLFSVVALSILSSGYINDAKADFILADPSSYTPAVSQTNNVSPEIRSTTGITGFHRGYGHDVSLDSVIKMLLPNKTWVIRYKSPEIRSILVDFRSEGMSIEDLYSDLASRYGLVISYGKTSGVITVDWKQQNECHKHTDEKTKTIVLC